MAGKCVHVSMRGQSFGTDSVIVGSSLHLDKQLCVSSAHTYVLGRQKGLESVGINM